MPLGHLFREKHMLKFKRDRGLRLAAGGVGALLAGTQFASAVANNYVWLTTPVSTNWNLTDLNWSGGSGTWVNDSGDTATFNVAPTGANSPLSLTDAILIQNLTFTTGGWTINAGG